MIHIIHVCKYPIYIQYDSDPMKREYRFNHTLKDLNLLQQWTFKRTSPFAKMFPQRNNTHENRRFVEESIFLRLVLYMWRIFWDMFLIDSSFRSVDGVTCLFVAIGGNLWPAVGTVKCPPSNGHLGGVCAKNEHSKNFTSEIDYNCF